MSRDSDEEVRQDRGVEERAKKLADNLMRASKLLAQSIDTAHLLTTRLEERYGQIEVLKKRVAVLEEAHGIAGDGPSTGVGSPAVPETTTGGRQTKKRRRGSRGGRRKRGSNGGPQRPAGDTD